MLFEILAVHLFALGLLEKVLESTALHKGNKCGKSPSSLLLL
jgi:hypothetical protein